MISCFVWALKEKQEEEKHFSVKMWFSSIAILASPSPGKHNSERATNCFNYFSLDANLSLSNENKWKWTEKTFPPFFLMKVCSFSPASAANGREKMTLNTRRREKHFAQKLIITRAWEILMMKSCARVCACVCV